MCVLLISILINACEKSSTPEPAKDDYIEYLIPKGSHYATENVYRSLHINKLMFSALFDSSCIYTTQSEWNAGDINKLYGFSDCNAGHHENSARFGWLWNGQSLEIHAYCYVGGMRQIKLMGIIPIGTPANMSISLEPGHYVFEMNGKTERMPRSCSSDYADGYQLYPYFGGDEAAPHEIRIRIKELK